MGTTDLARYIPACDLQANDPRKFFDPHPPAVLCAFRMAALRKRIGNAGMLRNSPNEIPTKAAPGGSRLIFRELSVFACFAVEEGGQVAGADLHQPGKAAGELIRVQWMHHAVLGGLAQERVADDTAIFHVPQRISQAMMSLVTGKQAENLLGERMFSAVLQFIGLAVINNLDKKTPNTMNTEPAARKAAAEKA